MKNLPNPDEEFESIPFSNAIDTTILMHRDVHFGGNFDVMLDYYNKGGKGIVADFDIKRIQELAQIEKSTQQNLAPILLSGADAETVARAKEVYKSLRELYEKNSAKNKYPLLIADLILTEDEEAQNEVAAIVAEKGAIVPALIQLLRSDEMYDSLFPGYGLAPSLAAKCLGMIGDKRAIISLFESIGESDLINEEITLEALRHIGKPAKDFLLKVLHGRPLNEDNERAAIALVQFKQDPEVSEACFEMLKDPEIRKDLSLSTYLVLACEGLANGSREKEFLAMAKDPSIPKPLRNDMMAVANEFKKI